MLIIELNLQYNFTIFNLIEQMVSKSLLTLVIPSLQPGNFYRVFSIFIEK